MPHPDRRQFLTSLASAGGAFTLGWATSAPGTAPRTEAQASPFFAQPDGQRCLVRFLVTGVSSPAGRLRVFDTARRLVGTAGVIARADGRLYGELWLPVGSGLRIATELTAPGLRSPLRAEHLVRQAPHWTIYWATLLAPETLEQTFAALGPIERAAETAMLRLMGAAVSPLPARVAEGIGDLPVLRLTEPAMRSAETFALTVSSLAAADPSQLTMPTLPAILAGSGVHRVVLRDAATSGLYRLEGPGGPPVLVAALPKGSDPTALGFEEGGDRMRQLVEDWLAAQPVASMAVGRSGGQAVESVDRTALAVGDDPERLPHWADTVRDWNARLAFPRIVVGQAERFFEGLERGPAADVAPSLPGIQRDIPAAGPTLEQVTSLAQARAAERVRHAEAMIQCLVGLLTGGGRGLDAVAARLAFSLPGTLVFNPSSYPRTDLVQLADTSYRVVTDVPALGYTYVPLGGGDAGGGRWRAMEDDALGYTIETGLFRITLDPGSGAIASLRSPGDGTEWVAPGGPGLNAIEGAQLNSVVRENLPGVGSRIVAVRRSPTHGALRSSVTIYEQMPWVEVVNDAPTAAEQPVEYGFAFSIQASGVEWEIPAGADRGVPPLAFTHLRWVRLLGQLGTVSLAALDAGSSRVNGDGMLTSHGPKGSARYRFVVRPAGAFAYPDDAWRLGWSVEPFLTAPVPGTGGATLASFGSLLVIDQPYIAVVGLQPAGDGKGLVVYLQELSGRARVATLGGGLIGFEDARLVDLVERDLGPPAMAMRNGVGVALAANGVAAVRLLGLRLAGG